jgi:hypothetical protein
VFCQFYPAYKIQDVLKLKARWFFRFLDQGYKLQAERLQREAIVAAIPHMEQKESKKIMESWSRAYEDPLEKFKPKTDYSGIEKLAQNMG